jgi:hypothetical protein
MRKTFFFAFGLAAVCVAFAAPAVVAGTTGVEVPELFSLRFVPETEPLAANEYQSPEPVSGLQPLSAKRAILYSLLLPGLGDYYAGHKTRATTFFMVDAGIWISYGVMKSQSSRREDAFQEMAVRYAGVSVTGLSDDYYSTIGQYNTHREYEAEFKKEHRIDIWPDVGYETMEQYYIENRVTDFEEWAWQSDEHRQDFRELRSSSRLSDRRAGYMFALAAANRVIAALFSYHAVKTFNDGLEMQTGGYRLDFSPPSKDYATSVSLVRFF